MDLVMSVLGLGMSMGHWAVANALPIVVGAMIGGPLAGAALGLAADMLGRAHKLVADVAGTITK